MKKNRLVAALLSLVMMVGALPGLVWAAIAYDVQVGASITLNSIDCPGPYYNGTPVGIVVSGGVPEYEGAFYNYSFYNTDGNVEVRSITLDSMDMGYFNVPNNIYAGDDSSRYKIDISPYYNTVVAGHDNCADYRVRFSDMITGETLIQSNSCPGGSKVRVYATPVDGYYIESVDYQYTFNYVSQTGIAELKTDSSGSYFEFVMPNSPVSISVHTTQNGHRYTSYVNAAGDTVYRDAIILDATSPNDLDNGWYVVTGEVEHAGRFNVAGNDVNIILEDGASLNAAAGIAVNEGNTLTIWGQSYNSGTLTATASSSGDAGIGSNSYSSCGTINIYGGTIVANGATDGPGIGLGHQGLGRSSGLNATINIHGGIITATGGWRGAGIGSGYNDEYGGGTLRINIDGGSINAIRGGWDRESFGSRAVASIGRGFTAYAIPCYIEFNCENHPYDIRIQGETYMTTTNNYHLTLVGDFVGSSGSTYAAGTYTDAKFLDGETLVSAVSQPRFTGHSLTVAGDIGVNYFVDMSMLTDAERQSATMEFTINGQTILDSFDENFKNEAGDYGFTVNITSVQMADTITAVLHIGDRTYNANDYSAQAYYDQLIADPGTYSEDVINFVKALKDYGHYIQPFLSANARTRWTVGIEHSEIAAFNTYDDNYLQPIYSIISGSATLYVPTVTSHDGINVTYSLDFETTTAIRLYIAPPEGGFAGPVSVTVDGQSVDPVLLSDGRYRIDINNISAKNLGVGHDIRFSYGEGEGQSFTVSNLSALSYVRLIMDNSNNFHNESEAQYAMCALYRYWQAAQNVD